LINHDESPILQHIINSILLRCENITITTTTTTTTL
jgi:hypothetical protein